MTEIICDDLAVCEDCALLIANGEVTDQDGDDISALVESRQARQWGPDYRGLVLTCDEDCDGWFSWSACDGCGSTLGGQRHPAAVLR